MEKVIIKINDINKLKKFIDIFIFPKYPLLIKLSAKWDIIAIKKDFIAILLK